MPTQAAAIRHKLYLTIRALALVNLVGMPLTGLGVAIHNDAEYQSQLASARAQHSFHVTTFRGGVIEIVHPFPTQQEAEDFIKSLHGSASMSTAAEIEQHEKLYASEWTDKRSLRQRLEPLLLGLLWGLPPFAIVLGLRRWWLWLMAPADKASSVPTDR